MNIFQTINPWLYFNNSINTSYTKVIKFTQVSNISNIKTSIKIYYFSKVVINVTNKNMYLEFYRLLKEGILFVFDYYKD